MKPILPLLFCFAFVLRANAQNEGLLPVDERGKFIYYEVVPLKETPRNLLGERALAYFKKQKDLKLKQAQGDTTFLGQGKMVIQKTLLVMSHPSGEILYRFETELREGKYRFWLSDFSFIPYQRDRYGNFVATTSIAVPLERVPDKLNKGQWIEYQEQAAKYAKAMAADFKQYMVGASITAMPAKEKTIVKKEW